ncbi:thioredoxin-dependent thiol peroxidase [Paenibacillus nanensis]|uniref:thioredoxin-dependent peroxiredoxin n=1 Tax=Paenibacillus nanensis TaxID=393251 RepID=A0A3A1URW6_9BACL|nr:thioredoxin-dependent thiol peroxidase [Paenibacillus nanensis]RIX51237.1 thioredoxin-dependent thiol peroxidase [Paenibacillus nanensis]
MSNTVKVGEKVPNFTLLASNGKEVSLADYKGKKLVIYFYPKDMTPGCTAESCDFRDFNGEFAKHNAEVVGISPDDLSSHEQFVSEYKLPFLLLSDPDHSVSELFGVWKELSWGGKTFLGVERSTFLIDEEGALIREWRSVNVEGHAAEVLEAVRA